MHVRLRGALPAMVLATLVGAAGGRAQDVPAERPAELRGPAALLATADSLYKTRAYPAAADAFERALAAAREAADPAVEVDVLIGMGAAYTLTGRVRESLPLYERALALAEHQENLRNQIRALQGMGIAHHDLAEHPAALTVYARALELAREAGDARKEGEIWNNIASVRYRQGDYTGAIEALEKTRATMPPDVPEYARVLSNIGRAHFYLGEYDLALAYYRDGQELAERLGDPHVRGILWNRLANLYEATGQNERAWEANEKSLAIARETGHRQGESSSLHNLGILRRKAGDAEGALAYFDQAYAIQIEDGDDTGAGWTLQDVAAVHRMRGDLAAARKTYEEALVIDARAGQRAQLAMSRIGLSAVLLDLGDAAAALAHADTARLVARETQRADLEARAEHRSGLALRALDRPAEALAALAAAVERIEGLRTALTTDHAKVGFLEERQAPFHALVDLLVERGRSLEALEVAERARGRAFVDLLAGRVVPAGGLDQDALADLEAAEAALETALATPDESGATGPGSLLALRAARARDETLAELAARDPELASLVSVQSLSGAQITALARATGTTLVEYLVADSALYAWVVSPDGAVAVHRQPIGRAALRERVERVRSTWEAGLASGLGPETAAADDLAALHALLIAPIASVLPDDPAAILVIVPHDALLLLPFAALIDAAGRFLVERHTLAYAPSASVLAWLEAGTAGEAATGWLGVGDPALPPDAGLDRLPWAAREVQGIAARFPPGDRITLLGEQATEAAVRVHAPRHAVLHLATHGIISDDDPLSSALLLTPGGSHDGYLRTTEIFGLDLAAELVILSGCSTGLGKLTGDGVLGLARAFLYAGTPAIVVSQWDVSDRATAELMERFYAARFETGASSAHALREAQLALLERYRHPYLWAAFELIGRPR